MFDKQMFKQLEKMLGQLSTEKKEKLAGILKDEESIKNALKNIDPIVARKAVENVHVDGISKEKLEKMAEELAKNPNLIQKPEKDK